MSHSVTLQSSNDFAPGVSAHVVGQDNYKEAVLHESHHVPIADLDLDRYDTHDVVLVRFRQLPGFFASAELL